MVIKELNEVFKVLNKMFGTLHGFIKRQLKSQDFDELL